MALVSIAMASYNAEKYISIAIESIISQTFEDWELIIVDDKSTDTTYEIESKYAQKDSRIKLYRSEKNSGSARQPRMRAISMMNSKWMTFLDADDYFEPTYLERMLKRQEHTQADVVLSKMVIVDDNKNILNTIPKEGYDTDVVLSGKEACSRTIGEWQIGGNGLLLLLLYRKAVSYNDIASINEDEVDTRRILINANKVALSDIKYFYRNNPSSITRHLSIHTLGNLDTAWRLLKFVETNYGKDSEEFNKQLIALSETLCLCGLAYYKLLNSLSPEYKNEYKLKLKAIHKACSQSLDKRKNLNWKKKIMLRNYTFFTTINKLRALKS